MYGKKIIVLQILKIEFFIHFNVFLIQKSNFSVCSICLLSPTLKNKLHEKTKFYSKIISHRDTT